MTDLEALKAYQFRRVARCFLNKGKFVIKIEDEPASEREKMIYVFVIDDSIVRIGSSKGLLRRRFRAWEHDVTKALQGQKSSTPAWEAREWRKRLEKHHGGIIFARQGSEVTTPIGTFATYLDEESVLIGRHQPALNRSKHR